MSFFIQIVLNSWNVRVDVVFVCLFFIEISIIDWLFRMLWLKALLTLVILFVRLDCFSIGLSVGNDETTNGQAAFFFKFKFKNET